MDLWLNPAVEAKYPSTVKLVRAEIKNHELPILDSYEEGVSDSFWSKFPKKTLPKKAAAKVNILELRKMVLKAGNKMSRCELKRESSKRFASRSGRIPKRYTTAHLHMQFQKCF